MNRFEFMQRLEQLLSDISQKEKEEALTYYNDYLNDAGVENEQEVIESLGSPDKVATTIKEGLLAGSSFGEFTENGFEDPVSAGERKHEMEASYKGGTDGRANDGYGNGRYQGNPWSGSYEEKADAKQEKKLSGWMIALIVAGCILASPLLISAAMAVIGGVVCGILALFIGVAAAGIGLFIAAVILIGLGIGEMFSTPLIGLCLLGTGLLLGGFAVLFIWLAAWMCGTVIPWLIRKTAELSDSLFRRKGGNKA